MVQRDDADEINKNDGPSQLHSDLDLMLQRARVARPGNKSSKIRTEIHFGYAHIVCIIRNVGQCCLFQSLGRDLGRVFI